MTSLEHAKRGLVCLENNYFMQQPAGSESHLCGCTQSLQPPYASMSGQNSRLF